MKMTASDTKLSVYNDVLYKSVGVSNGQYKRENDDTRDLIEKKVMKDVFIIKFILVKNIDRSVLI